MGKQSPGCPGLQVLLAQLELRVVQDSPDHQGCPDLRANQASPDQRVCQEARDSPGLPGPLEDPGLKELPVSPEALVDLDSRDHLAMLDSPAAVELLDLLDSSDLLVSETCFCVLDLPSCFHLDLL